MSAAILYQPETSRHLHAFVYGPANGLLQLPKRSQSIWPLATTISYFSFSALKRWSGIPPKQATSQGNWAIADIKTREFRSCLDIYSNSGDMHISVSPPIYITKARKYRPSIWINPGGNWDSPLWKGRIKLNYKASSSADSVIRCNTGNFQVADIRKIGAEKIPSVHDGFPSLSCFW